MQRTLMIAGAILFAVGALWPWISKIGLGRLPGDIAIRREHFQFYFPVVSCIAVSAAISLIAWFLRR